MALSLLRSALITLPLAAGVAAHAQAPVIVDNTDPGFSVVTGEWLTGTGAADKYGTDYRFADNVPPGDAPTAVASWTIPVATAGDYDVAVFYPQGSNRSEAAPFTVTGSAGSQTVFVNQKTNGGQFNSIGAFHFNAGSNAVVTLANNAPSNVVLADAVRLTPITGGTGDRYRFFWASRFQWPSSNRNTAQSNIRTIFQRAADYNFNAVFFQVRGQMDTHYPSPYEPWSDTYGWTNPGWNPLQYAIDQAHSRGIKLHAYINTHTVSGPIPPSVTTPQHQHNLHGNHRPVGERWGVHDSAGNPISGDGYLWLSPGIAEASFHTRREIMHVVDNYDVDGIHIDRIRLPGVDATYDQATMERFEGDANPHDLPYREFLRDLITRDLRKLYGAIQNSKPHVELSVTPIGISRRNSDTQYQGTGSNAWYNYAQDSWAWLQANVIDFSVPQIYWEIGGNHPYEKLLADWTANAGERWIVPGSRTDKTVASDGPKPLAGLLAEVQTAVDLGAMGNCFWQWQSLSDVPPGESQSYYEALKAGPYQAKVNTPQMPWKTHPTTGYIIGYVTDDNGDPVLDARIQRDGEDYAYLSAWDGFFAILDVPPGTTHSLTVTKMGAGSQRIEGIAVTAGQVTSANVELQPNRGFVEFPRTRLDHARYSNLPVVPAQNIRLYDANLTAPTVNVHLHSPTDPFGATITLFGDGTGNYGGSFVLNPQSMTAGDSALRALPGDTITVQYLDADDGTGASQLFVSQALIRIPDDVVVESRQPNGFVSPSTVYQESGTWSSTPTRSPNNQVTKSLAPGLNGLGGRRASSGSAYATYKPPMQATGLYDVYITLPGADQSDAYRAPNAQVRIFNGVNTITKTVDLTSTNPDVAGNWLLLEAEVPFAGGSGAAPYIEVRSTVSPSSLGGYLGADAVKLVFNRPLGERTTVDDWAQYEP